MPPSTSGSWCDLRSTNTQKTHKMMVINLRLKLSHLLVKNTGEQIFMFAWSYIYNTSECFTMLCSVFSSSRIHKELWVCVVAEIVRNHVNSLSRLFTPPQAPLRILPFFFLSFCCRQRLSSALHGFGVGTRRLKTHRCLIDGLLSGDTHVFGWRLHLNRFTWQDSV